MDTLTDFLNTLLGLDANPEDLKTYQMAARAIVVSIAALIMLRLAHKRFFARRNALDVLLTLIIASSLSRAINGSAAFFPTLAVGFMLVLLHRGVSWLAVRSAFVGNLLKGHSAVLIDEGNVQPAMLDRHDLSREDLDEDLRLKGVDSPAKVRRATLERNGEVSVVKSDGA
ncbi:YetF domain-containing protein [Opitutus sp. ER46]|uniref:DUF421 domain-containing protein n=1 Tax=Opitutus sp. ER46 TaxID=2161864 RepID=UPI001304D0CF|nr:YetF domain-containing protein [Opitutus sp. ER46]